MHHCLKVELHCSAVKRHGQFLMKMNGLMIFFSFLLFFPHRYRLVTSYILLSWNKETPLVKSNGVLESGWYKAPLSYMIYIAYYCPPPPFVKVGLYFLSSQMVSHGFSPSSLSLHKAKWVQLNGKTLQVLKTSSLVGLIDAKGNNVAQPIWSWVCPTLALKEAENAFLYL